MMSGRYFSDQGLINAARSADLKEVQSYIEAGADIHVQNDLPLRLACEHGQLELIKYLVAQGADISANDHQPLKWAVLRGRFEAVKYLVAEGADIHADDDMAFKWACAGGFFNIIRYFVEQGEAVYRLDDTALKLGLLTVSKEGYDEMVDYLISKIDWDKADEAGFKGVARLMKLSAVDHAELYQKIEVYINEQAKAKRAAEMAENQARVYEMNKVNKPFQLKRKK